MDSPNISDFQGGSRLLSESSLLPSTSSSSLRTGPGGDDLSLSELSLPEHPGPGLHKRRPFSLLAQPRLPDPPDKYESAIVDDDADLNAEGAIDHTLTQEDVEKVKRLAAKTREEKLQHDLFILKKLNGAFGMYKEALKECKSSTERVASQLEHTNALLDKYVKILSKSESITRLIMDERWQGAEVDEEIIERERKEVIEKARREKEERALAAQRELERQEREEQERREREERERREREQVETSTLTRRGSGVRGVRGTRASMRGTRGAGAPTVIVRGARGTAAMKRPASSASTRSAGMTDASRAAPRRN